MIHLLLAVISPYTPCLSFSLHWISLLGSGQAMGRQATHPLHDNKPATLNKTQATPQSSKEEAIKIVKHAS
jgi:hypothetical protein